MIGLALLAVGLVGQLLFGLFLAAQLLSIDNRSRSEKEKWSIEELAGLGLVLGIGATAWCLFVWSFCGGRLGLLPSGILTIVGFACGIPAVRQCLKETRVIPLDSPAEHQTVAVRRVCQCLLGGLFLAAIIQTVLTPQKLWDERAIFAIKASVLFEDQSLESPALKHPDFVQYHPRYPLLIPLAEQHIYALNGSVDDRLSKIIFPLMYIGLVLATIGVLSRHVTTSAAWLGGLMMATVPVMMPYEYGFLCGQADAPVACYHGVTVLYLWDALRRQCRGESFVGAAMIAGLCAGLTAFTKDEGIAFLMIDLGALGLLTLGSLRRFPEFRRQLMLTILFVATGGMLLAPWFWHRRGLPLTTEMNYFGRMTPQLLLSRLDTLQWSVPHLCRRMLFEWREWGLQWWLVIAAILNRPFQAIKKPQLLLLLDLAGALTSLLVAGMAAPAQLDEHIGGSSHRFLMQITPWRSCLPSPSFTALSNRQRLRDTSRRQRMSRDRFAHKVTRQWLHWVRPLLRSRFIPLVIPIFSIHPPKTTDQKILSRFQLTKP